MTHLNDDINGSGVPATADRLHNNDDPQAARLPTVWNPLHQARRLAVDAWRRGRAFAHELQRDYGWRFLTLIALIYMLMKGVGYNGLTYTYLPYYRNVIGVSAADMQRFTAVSGSAWSLKPMIGIICDRFALFGYHRRYYMLIFCVTCVGMVLLNTLVLQRIPVGGFGSVLGKGEAVAAAFFIAEFSVAGTDLLLESRYSSMMNVMRASPAIITFAWAGFSIGGTAASLVEGPVSDHVSADAALWAFAPFFAAPIVPILLGWLPEARATGKKGDVAENPSPPVVAETEEEAAAAGELPGTHHDSDQPLLGGAPDACVTAVCVHAADGGPTTEAAPTARDPTGRSLLIMGVLSTAVSALITSLQLLSTPMLTLAIAGPAVLLLSLCALKLLPRVIAYASLYWLLKKVLNVNISSFMSYFFTAGEACLPGGPAFSYTFYQTLANALSGAGQIAGTALFQRYLSSFSFRRLAWLTTALTIAANTFDALIAKRLNLRAGLSDQLFFAVGDGVVSPVIAMIDFMPISVLVSRVCPRGHEATTYAMLIAFSNFGGSLSAAIGTLLAARLDIEATADGPCNFDRLWLLVVVAHMLLPLGTFALAYLLLPNTPIDQPLATAEDSADAPLPVSANNGVEAMAQSKSH